MLLTLVTITSLLTIAGSALAQTCESFGDDFQNGGSYFQNSLSSDPFTALQEFEGCQNDTANNVLVDPNGDQSQCSNTPLLPNDTPQLITCADWPKDKLYNGSWSLLIISNNGNGNPIAYQRDFSLSVGPQHTLTVSATATITNQITPVVNVTQTSTSTYTTTVPTSTTTVQATVTPTTVTPAPSVVTVTKGLFTLTQIVQTVQVSSIAKTVPGKRTSTILSAVPPTMNERAASVEYSHRHRSLYLFAASPDPPSFLPYKAVVLTVRQHHASYPRSLASRTPSLRLSRLSSERWTALRAVSSTDCRKMSPD